VIADLGAKVGRGRGFREQLYILISEHLATFVAERNLCRLFISEVRIASDYRGSAIQQLNRRYTSILIKMVEDAEASGDIPSKVDPRVVRDMLFGAIEHSAWRHTIGKRPIDVDSLARAITDIFLAGLCPSSTKS
jgi:TetR/AcrR family transcriptional regulator, fatty acid metabolism regulator protein